MLSSDFLAIFPEFASTTQYPTARVTFWIGVAASLVDPTRWGTLANQGQALLTAHYLVLDQEAQQEAMAQNANAASGIGSVSGPEVSKAVDGVSVSQDVASVTITGAGLYNQTRYGIQYYQLAQMMGAGGMQFAY